MDTSIQISNDLLSELRLMKTNSNKSYEDIIWDLLEDNLEFSDETKKNIAQSEQEIKEGKTTSLEELKKDLNL